MLRQPRKPEKSQRRRSATVSPHTDLQSARGTFEFVHAPLTTCWLAALQAKKEVEPSSFKAEGFFDDDEEEDGGADDALGVMGSAMKKGLGDAMGKAGSLTDKLGDKLPVSSDKLDGIKSMTGKLGDKVSSDKLDGIKGMSVSSATGALTGGLTSVMNMSGVSGVTVTDHDLSMGEEAPLTIKANAKAIYHVPVKQAEGALMWNFTVGKDVVGGIRFSVTFKSNSATASEDAEAIDGWADSRHDAEEGSKKGCTRRRRTVCSTWSGATRTPRCGARRCSSE